MNLPNYLKRSPKTGVFSFRMAVPEKLRSVIGKREVKQSLKTKDHRKALVMAMRLHEEWKGRFLAAEQSLTGRTGGSASALTMYDEAVSWLAGLGYEPQRIAHVTSEEEYWARDDLADELIEEYQRKADPLTSTKIAALQGSLKRPVPSVRDAVNLYLHEKNPPGKRTEAKAKWFDLHIRRNERYLLASLKRDKPLTEISREDARKFRDYLKERKDSRDGTALKPESVNRSLQAIMAVFNHAITEFQLDIVNPFKKLAVGDPESKRDKRHSFTDEQLEAYLAAASEAMNSEAKHCTVLMAYTGARTDEIAGLEVQDVKLDDEEISHIFIRPNQTRPKLKSEASSRVLPLIGPALASVREAVEEARKRNGDETSLSNAPLFPRYGRPRGADALSAIQNKLIRKKLKITDPKITAYSTRHRMKDKLRNALIDSDLQDAITAHARGQSRIADRYGNGYLLEVLSKALKKALGIVDDSGPISTREKEEHGSPA
jgi:integrase